MKIKIITDSSSDLPAEIQEKYDIAVAPLKTTFGTKTYFDRTDLDSMAFFEKLEADDHMPITSQVNPEEFKRLFSKYLDDYDAIIGIFITDTLSGTINSARIAKEELGVDNIYIIDSEGTSLTMVPLVKRIGEYVNDGLTPELIVSKIDAAKKHIELAVLLNTLKYMVKGGRVSRTTGMVGKLLKIKPILTIKDKELFATDKVRGMKQGIKWIEKWIDDNHFDLKEKEVFLLRGGKDNRNFNDFLNLLKEKYKVENPWILDAGAVIGTHSGPGVVGFCIIND